MSKRNNFVPFLTCSTIFFLVSGSPNTRYLKQSFFVSVLHIKIKPAKSTIFFSLGVGPSPVGVLIFFPLCLLRCFLEVSSSAGAFSPSVFMLSIGASVAAPSTASNFGSSEASTASSGVLTSVATSSLCVSTDSSIALGSVVSSAALAAPPRLPFLPLAMNPTQRREHIQLQNRTDIFSTRDTECMKLRRDRMHETLHAY
ncbi:hypothetical protein L7F22_045414 [Adiantum nelumboides]|nr:hypothetical protein [Adiantum nelumboides]